MPEKALTRANITLKGMQQSSFELIRCPVTTDQDARTVIWGLNEHDADVLVLANTDRLNPDVIRKMWVAAQGVFLGQSIFTRHSKKEGLFSPSRPETASDESVAEKLEGLLLEFAV